MLFHLSGKQDVFDKTFETIKRKLRIEAIIFNEYQKMLFDAFQSIYKGEKIVRHEYIGKKGWLKVYFDVLINVPFEEAVRTQFDSSKFLNLPEEITFLEWLRSL